MREKVQNLWLTVRRYWQRPKRGDEVAYKEIAAFSKNVKHIIVPELNAGQLVHEVERAVKGNCEVHGKSLINGELYKPAEIMSFIKEVA